MWYFIFDRYGSESSLQALAGIDNDLPDWLEAQGFEVARHAHANYGRTAMSLAATLNLAFLDDIAAQMGPGSKDVAPVNERLQDHWVGRFFQDKGYRYVHLGSWFGATKTNRIADENPTLDSATDFDVMLEQTTFAPTLASIRNLPEPPKHHVLHRSAGLFDLRELERIRTEPGPKFVLAHLLLPHEPYVFDEFGDYPTQEERDARGLDEGFRRQLDLHQRPHQGVRGGAARRCRRRSARSSSSPPTRDPTPTPTRPNQAGYDWGTATADELETKYGILTAFYLPGADPAGRARAVRHDDLHQHLPGRAVALLGRRLDAAPRPDLDVRRLVQALRPDRRHRPPAAAGGWRPPARQAPLSDRTRRDARADARAQPGG